MKIGSAKCLTIFSGLAIIGVIFEILFFVTLIGGSTFGVWLTPLAAVLGVTSAIGTFVCGIIVTSQSKNLSQSKGKMKSAGIVGIVAGALCMTMVLAPVGAIMILVTFGLSLSALSNAKKNNEFIQ